jgi:hypothetical protein
VPVSMLARGACHTCEPLVRKRQYRNGMEYEVEPRERTLTGPILMKPFATYNSQLNDSTSSLPSLEDASERPLGEEARLLSRSKGESRWRWSSGDFRFKERSLKIIY